MKKYFSLALILFTSLIANAQSKWPEPSRDWPIGTKVYVKSLDMIGEIGTHVVDGTVTVSFRDLSKRTMTAKTVKTSDLIKEIPTTSAPVCPGQKISKGTKIVGNDGDLYTVTALFPNGKVELDQNQTHERYIPFLEWNKVESGKRGTVDMSYIRDIELQAKCQDGFCKGDKIYYRSFKQEDQDIPSQFKKELTEPTEFVVNRVFCLGSLTVDAPLVSTTFEMTTRNRIFTHVKPGSKQLSGDGAVDSTR